MQDLITELEETYTYCIGKKPNLCMHTTSCKQLSYFTQFQQVVLNIVSTSKKEATAGLGFVLLILLSRVACDSDWSQAHDELEDDL